MSRMFRISDIAIRLSSILYVKRSWEYEGFEKKFTIEIKLKLEFDPVRLHFKTQKERDTVYETLIEQIEES